MIPQKILSQHPPQEWIDSAFEILLAHALFGDLPHFNEGNSGNSVRFLLIPPLSSPFSDHDFIRPPDIPTFYLARDEIHNINVIINLKAREGYHSASIALSHWITSNSFSKVCGYYLSIYDNQEQRLHSVNSNGFRYIRDIGKNKKPLHLSPDNCCRSCGRKVPLTAGLCEECQKLESLMKDCFDTNVSLTNHVGQTYEEGIVGGVD